MNNMKTVKKGERAKYRVIVRNDETYESQSFPIYHDSIDIKVLAKKLEEYVNKL